MKLLNAKQFAAESGFPLAMVRRFCRIGLIPHWKSGRTYLMDFDAALEAMKNCQETPVSSCASAAFSGSRVHSAPGSSAYSSFLRQIDELKSSF